MRKLTPHLVVFLVFLLTACNTNDISTRNAFNATCFDDFIFSKEVDDLYRPWAYRQLGALPAEVCAPKHSIITAEGQPYRSFSGDQAVLSVAEKNPDWPYGPPSQLTMPYVRMDVRSTKMTVTDSLLEWGDMYNREKYEIANPPETVSCLQYDYQPPDKLTFIGTPTSFADGDGEFIKFTACDQQFKGYLISFHNHIYIMREDFGYDLSDGINEELLINIIKSMRPAQ